jgi:hypothetical protein
MPVFIQNQSIETTGPRVSVENTNLAPGVHHFSLVVEDDQGHRSDPDAKAVFVQATPQ